MIDGCCWIGYQGIELLFGFCQLLFAEKIPRILVTQ
jgi:hypothetical protein